MSEARAIERSIKVIPSTFNRITQMPINSVMKRRVAAYARVSTDSEEQQTSYEAQVDHYTHYIQSKEEWVFVEVYTDDGISATNMKRRDGFKRMIADALNGKIDLIITKSVSRFARNTVDSLTTVRQLKEKGVEVYFEKENIYTLDSKGELLITIMSSLAQEESRSISENVTWGQRKRFADGKVSLPYKRFLGYEKGPDGLPQIVEEEAKTVRMIYGLFLEGKSTSAIAKHLMNCSIQTPGGKTNWRPNTVESILTNEKYKGDAILQKTFTVDFLMKTKKVNEGEVPQYYVENSHPAIISPEIFVMVQQEYKKRKASGKWTSSAHCFSGKIICGECGRFYGSRVWHSTDQYRTNVWMCHNRIQNADACRAPHMHEDTIREAFVKAINALIMNKGEIISTFEEIAKKMGDTTDFNAQLSELQDEYDLTMGILHQLLQENAHKAIDQEAFQCKYDAYMARFNTAKKKMADLEMQMLARKTKRLRMMEFLKVFRQQDSLINEFNERMWYVTVDTVTIRSAHLLTFTFKGGIEKDVEM